MMVDWWLIGTINMGWSWDCIFWMVRVLDGNDETYGDIMGARWLITVIVLPSGSD